MFTKLKLNTAFIAITAIVVTASITAPFTHMFGKHYRKEKDFSCCKGDQLIINHYYTVKFLWADVSSGYTIESTGKSLPSGCNIKCN